MNIEVALPRIGQISVSHAVGEGFATPPPGKPEYRPLHPVVPYFFVVAPPLPEEDAFEEDLEEEDYLIDGEHNDMVGVGYEEKDPFEGSSGRGGHG